MAAELPPAEAGLHLTKAEAVGGRRGGAEPGEREEVPGVRRPGFRGGGGGGRRGPEGGPEVLAGGLILDFPSGFVVLVLLQSCK